MPNLQLYIEGSTYDTTSDSWTHEVGTNDLRLWVIGNTSGPGSKGDLLDLNLVISINPTPVNLPPTLSLSGTTTGGMWGFTDPSIATDPIFVTDGMGSHPLLSPHGMFDSDQYWEQFDLGDMTLADSPIGDFYLTLPMAGLNPEGQINAYTVDTGFLDVGDTLHFDTFAFYTTKKGEKITVAPYSHDATMTTAVPEPATMLVLGSTLAGSLAARRRGKRKS